MEELNNFKNKIKKVNSSREHKVRDSYGTYDAYKYYRKNKPKESKYVLTESQYFNIIRSINKQLANNLLNGETVVFPHRMGSLILKKKESVISFKDGKLKTNLPVDWDSTLKLWYEDKESFENKVLIRMEERDLYKVCYDKSKANFNNKTFYTFNVNREIKVQLKNKIKNEGLDTPYSNYGRTIY